jgi:glycosyltransferase involved in cell wall biosynthesis
MAQVLKKQFLRVASTETKNTAVHKVSAVLITYNESANIRRTLNQLYWCNEIIIVDSFSTDGTPVIAREYGCRVIQRPFKGFGDQKAFAISQSVNDWILCIDADEFLTDDLIEEIYFELNDPGNNHAFAFPSNLVFREHRFRYGRESNRYVVRLFNRRYGRMSNDKVHESIQVEGRIKRLRCPLIHYSYHDINQYFCKFARYTDWCAETYYLGKRRKPKAMMAICVPFYFFKYYFLEGNILNGINGFYWSALMSFYHLVKYIKVEDLYELD